MLRNSWTPQLVSRSSAAARPKWLGRTGLVQGRQERQAAVVQVAIARQERILVAQPVDGFVQKGAAFLHL